MKKLLQFGAGKIGRSFIAQLFSKAGYQIIFADIDPCLVKSLNEAGAYNVIIKSDAEDQIYSVKNVSAIEITSRKEMIRNIIAADIISISVGKKSLLNLAEILSEGIQRRYLTRKSNPIDIILAENVREAGELLSSEMEKYAKDIPLRDYVGFVETSIGRMVPIMTPDQLKLDPLAIYTEAYNNLIVDEKGFRNTIPEIPNLFPKSNMKAWVDRRFFIHNLGHAVLAFQTFYKYPEISFTWEAVAKKDIYKISRANMLQSAAILIQSYPDEFTMEQLKEHIDDLLLRFSNKALGDTIFRVGSDLSRKLGRDDRFIIPIVRAMSLELEYGLILESWVKGSYFAAKDEDGEVLAEDRKFRQKYAQKPKDILIEHCKLSREHEVILMIKIDEIVKNLN